MNNGISLDRTTSGSVSLGCYDWTLSPAHPGDEVVLWGTGGGADSVNDAGGSSGDQTAAGSFTVSVDGTTIVPLYSGTSSGYPGLWQVNFVLPSSIAADCFASVTVTGGGQTSNLVTLANRRDGSKLLLQRDSRVDSGKARGGTGTSTMAGLVIGQNVINGAVSYEIGSGKIGMCKRSEPDLLGRRQGALGTGYAVGCRHCES